MERKEQDLLLNLAGNPTSNIQDLMQSGLSVFNTSLEDKQTYQNSESIQKNPQFQDNTGEFDLTKLDNSYKSAVIAYNYMSEDQLNKYIMDSAKYSPQNIFAPIKQRDYSQGFVYHKLQNPDRITRGLVGVGKNSTPEFSASELAQNEEVIDYKTGKKMAKPNGNWFKYFDDTLVLAQYEKDVDINGIEEGQAGFDSKNIEHRAGEYKLNENGTYYYETLGGRDVTNKKVLWKGNTLTTDGSWANRHLDFFDSDDIDQNSGAKTVLKNLALVGSMFIPGVGEYIALTSAVVQTAGLFGTIDRMITGDSSEFARNLEGWAQSMNRQTGRTEEATANPWSMESFVNLVADVVGQLREQRAIFKNVPKLFNGGKGVNKEYLKELEDKYLRELNAASKIPAVKEGTINFEKAMIAQKELFLANQQRASKMVSDYTKKFYDLGGDISKLYMTGITVQNAYGEAIQQGANPMDAFLYTLGYAAAEWKLLNTGVGEWILPELRMQSAEHKQIIRTIFSDIINSKGISTATTTGSKMEKSAIIRKLMNMGRQVAHTDYTLTKGVLSNAAANALGEGVEEVSEELLADLAKQAYNTVKWMTGSTSRLDAWQDMTNRYLLSFFGGAIGGSIAGVDLKYANALKNMTTEQATEKMVAISRDPDQRDAFFKNLDKLDLGRSHLSATKYETDEEGRFTGWKPGTKEDNQDKFAKDVVKEQFRFIDNILDANNGKLDDDSILKEVIKDVRYGALLHSNAGNRVIARFNTIMSKIVSATQQLQNINSPENQAVNGDHDQKDKESQTTKNQRKQVEEELKALIKEKDDLLSGKYSAELALESLIEMNPYVLDKLGGMSAIRYAEAKAGTSYDKIPDKLKDKYLSDYKNIAETNGKDTVALLTDQYLRLSNVTLPALQEMYDSLQNNLGQAQRIAKLSTGIISYLNALNSELQHGGTETFLETVQGDITDLTIQEKALLTLLDGLYTEDDVNTLKAFREAYQGALTPEEKEAAKKEHNKYILQLAYNKVLPLVQEVIDNGYVNSVVRQNLINSLTLLRDQFQRYAQEGMDSTRIQTMLNKLEDIEQVKHTPIERVLDKFLLDANLADVRFTGLINSLQTFFNDVKKDITEFLPSGGLLERVGEAIQLLDLFEGIVYGARTDKLGIDLIQDSGTREYKFNPNYFGINNIVKELAETYGADDLYKALPTIEGTLADQITQDLSVLKKQLVFYYDLLAVNSGQKLSKQKRTDVNLKYLIYKHIKNFVITIPEDWKDKDKLQGVLDSMVFTEAHYTSDNKSLGEEDQVTLEKEYISMLQGIHDFFAANQDKVDNVDELAKLLNPNNFDLTDEQVQTLTENTTQMDGHVLISFLAAVSAINPTDFYANYKEQIKAGIAPIPGQELAIFHAVALALNGDQIAKFVETTRKGFYNAIVSEKDDNKRREIIGKIGTKLLELDTDELRQYIMNEWVIPQFSNIMLIEGIPGAGKTDAVLQITQAMLKSNPEVAEKVLKNAWFVHTSAKNAEKLNKDASLENASYYGHQDLIQKISDWEKNLENIIVDEHGIIQPKFSLKHLDNVPSIIFIDEVSKYTTLELKIIDKFAQAHGISVITLGDFDQSPAKATIILPTINIPYNLKLNRTSFYSTFKLGDSFRITNVQKEKNLGLLQTTIQTDNDTLALHYHINEKGLFGDLIYDEGNIHYKEEKPILDQEIKADGPTIKEIIDLMLATTNEKIGFVYFDEKSDIAQELLKPEYADKIEPYKSSVAQGMESQYFIIDFAEYDDDLDFNDFYTAITRSAKGSLCYIKEGVVTLGNNPPRVIRFGNPIEDEITYDSSLPSKSVEEFGKKRKERLDKIYEGKSTNPLTYKAPTKHNDVPIEKKPVVSTSETVTALETETINVDTPLLTGTEFGVPKKIEKDKKDATIKDNVDDTESLIHEEDGVIKIDLAVYTHASFELGLDTWNPNGTPDWSNTPPEVREGRLDSYYGIEKLFGEKTRVETLELLSQLHSRLLNVKDKGILEENIGEFLGLSNCYITFAIKNCSNPSNGLWNNYSKGHERFAKRKDEQLTDIFVEDKRAHQANRRQFIAIIGTGDTDVLEIPLGTLASPITIINTQDSEGNYRLPEVKQIYQAAVDASGTKNPYEGIKAVIDKFDNNPKYTDLIYLCKLWINTGNVIAYQKDPTWTPAKNLLDQGGQVDQLKGLLQTRDEILQYSSKDEEPNSIKEIASSPNFIVSKILVPRRTLKKGKFDVKAGQPIVLWAAASLLQQNELEEQFLNENPDVKFAYVNIPSYTVTEYLTSLHNLATRNGQPVGNIFTAYQIMDRLAFNGDGSLNKEFETFVKKLNPLNGQDIYNTLIDQLKELREIKPDESILDVNQRHTNYNKKLKAALLGQSAIFNGRAWAKSGSSMASQFQNIFIKLTETKIRTSGDMVIIDDNVKKIDELAGEYRVFDQVKLSQDSPNSSDFIEILTDPGDNYSLNGKEFTMSSKPTSKAFLSEVGTEGNMMDWIQNIVKDVFYDEDGNHKSKDNKNYLAKHSKIADVAPPSKIDTLFQDINKVLNNIGEEPISEEEIAEIKENYSDFSEEEAVPKILNLIAWNINISDRPYLAINIGDDIVIIELGTTKHAVDDSKESQDFFDSQKIDGSYEVILNDTAGNPLYRITYNPTEDKAEVFELIQSQQNIELNQVQEILKNDVSIQGLFTRKGRGTFKANAQAIYNLILTSTNVVSLKEQLLQYKKEDIETLSNWLSQMNTTQAKLVVSLLTEEQQIDDNCQGNLASIKKYGKMQDFIG